MSGTKSLRFAQGFLEWSKSVASLKKAGKSSKYKRHLIWISANRHLDIIFSAVSELNFYQFLDLFLISLIKELHSETNLPIRFAAKCGLQFLILEKLIQVCDVMKN